MTDDLQRILEQLLDAERKLRDLPADAFEQRVELRDRLVELRAAAGAAARESDMASSLRRYLGQLELRRDAIKDRRIDDSGLDGGLGGVGIPSGQTDELNRRIEYAADLPSLEQEIARINQRLAADTGN